MTSLIGLIAGIGGALTLFTGVVLKKYELAGGGLVVALVGVWLWK